MSRPRRYFFVIVAVAMLTIIVAGFHPYYLSGKGLAGRTISPDLGQFLLIMLMEVACFTLFVLTGVLFRKRPKIHKAMMLLASLSILAGATVRMPVLFPVFGEDGWTGIFGPVFALGAVFAVARSLMGRSLDRWLAAGCAVMAVVYVAASQFAVSDAWNRLARALLDV